MHPVKFVIFLIGCFTVWQWAVYLTGRAVHWYFFDRHEARSRKEFNARFTGAK